MEIPHVFVCIRVSVSINWQTIGNKILPLQQFADYLSCSITRKRRHLNHNRKNHHCGWYCNHNIYLPSLFSEKLTANIKYTYIWPQSNNCMASRVCYCQKTTMKTEVETNFISTGKCLQWNEFYSLLQMDN